MGIRIGDLRHRLVLEQSVRQDDGAGGADETWVVVEELWAALGHDKTLAHEPWPEFDESLIKEDTVEVPVQINGKLRSRIRVPADSSEEEQAAAARLDQKVAQHLKLKQEVKVIVKRGRMVNFVVK